MVDNSFDSEDGFSTVSLEGSSLGNSLTELLLADDINPGDPPGYNTCKVIYLFHPLGAKIAEKPIAMAMTKPREIEVKDAPSERIKDKFNDQWTLDEAETQIFQTAVLSRVYGVSGLAAIIEGEDVSQPLDYWKLPNADLTFNVLDPLNMAGSFTTTQNPNASSFMKFRQMRIAGTRYHRSRFVTKINEQPIYLGWTNSAFGYTGRSVYQRALYPLKSFVQTMITDDMVARKAGVLIAKVKAQGSIISRLGAGFTALKRLMLRLAKTGNVISIDLTEDISTLNMQNVDGAMTTARKDILENIAAAVPMPALLLNDETMGGDFHEGTEDANAIAQWVDGVRKDLLSLYVFMEKIIQHRAWTPEFYVTIQSEFPEYKDVEYEAAFYKWRNSFSGTWPELIKEPESESIKVEETKLGGMFQAMDRILPLCDPESTGAMVDFVVSNMNEMKLMFTVPLMIDTSRIIAFAKEKQDQLKQAQEMQQQTIDGDSTEDDPDKPVGGNKSVASGTVVRMPKKVAIGAS